MINLCTVSTLLSTTILASSNTLQERFQTAASTVKRLKVGPQDQLQIYGWYKQATVGDIQGIRPGRFDFRARHKFDRWESLRGMSKDAAMQAYIDFVDELVTAASS